MEAAFLDSAKGIALGMDMQTHWEQLYRTKAPNETSWYEPHLETSLDWVLQAASDRSAAIIDIGAGESTLVDDLLGYGYVALTVLDVSDQAIQKAQQRLGPATRFIQWIVSDIAEAALAADAYDVWHDRAVFHFLVEPEQRSAYVRQLVRSLKARGQVVIATFGPDGPAKCSGLDVMRYDAVSLHYELGTSFQLVRKALVPHKTPFGSTQQFLYCQFSLDAASKEDL